MHKPSKEELARKMAFNEYEDEKVFWDLRAELVLDLLDPYLKWLVEKYDKKLRKELDKNASAYLNKLQVQQREMTKQHDDEIREAEIKLTERIRENAVDSFAGIIWMNHLIANLKSQRKNNEKL